MKKVLHKTCVVCGRAFDADKRNSAKKTRCSKACMLASRFRRGVRAYALSETHAAYLAGILDGEGSVVLYRRRLSVGLYLSVASTSAELLDWITRTTGVGRVHVQRRATARRKASWGWRADADAAESILQQVSKYLVIKTAQAALALAFRQRLRTPALKADGVWQAAWHLQMRQLNKKGPPTVQAT